MITRYLHRNPQMAVMIILAIIAAGVSCLYVMPRLEDPVLKQRVGVVSVTLVGASASEIESSVVVPIEEWLSEFSEIKHVRSNTRANVANVVIELADHVSEPEATWAAIDNKLRTESTTLPEASSGYELTVFPLKAFAAIIALVPTDLPDATGKEQTRDELRLAKEFKQRLLRLEGTESVEIFGGINEELLVELTPEILAATGLSPGSIANQIKLSEAMAGGNVHRNGQSLGLEIQQEEDLVRRIESVPIQIPGNSGTNRLGELASLSIKPRSPATEMAIVKGRPAVVIGAMVDNQRRVDLWTVECLDEMRRLGTEFPGSYEAVPLFLQADQIESRMNNLLRNLALSTIAVVVIIFLFLGWRCMLVVAMTLPLSACLVVCGLRFLDIPIHQMSVTGLIVSLGLLIDNAIVMVEEVRARIYDGKQPALAISESTRHLGLPLLGSTLTTILTFLPIATMPGPSGEFVGSLAVSVILAISASLLLSFSIVPPMVAFFGVDSFRDDAMEYGVRAGVVGDLYKSSLRFVFQRPMLGVLLGVAFPVAGFLVAGELEKQFFPATDRAQIQIELDLPLSSNLEATRRCVDRAMSVIEANGFVESQHWFLGRSAPTFYYNVVPRRRSTPNYAQAFVDLNANDSIDSVVNRLQAELDAEVLDARVVVRKLEQGPPFDAPIEIRVLGDNLQLLEEVGGEIRELIASHPNVTHTRADLGDKSPRLSLNVDENLAAQIGISDNQISRQLFVNVEGAKAGDFSRGNSTLPVRVAVNYTDRSVINSLLALPVATHRAGQAESGPPNPEQANSKPVAVSLGSVAKFELTSDPGAIIRHDGQRVNEVKAYLQAGVLPSEVLAGLKASLFESGLRLPAGCRIEIGGEAEKRSDAVSTLVANIVLIVVLMVVTLVAVLGSIRLALIIAAVAGLVVGLGPLSLYVFGYPFGFMAIVGAMGLIGIAINDSIVVLAGIKEDFGAERDDDSESVAEKLANVVVKRTRHILATTITTMIGFLPLVLGGGKFWPPLAIVIAAGVAGATILALYFTPSMYLLLFPNGVASVEVE